MAEYKTTVALEIGAQSVTMAVFTPSSKGFTLSRYARRDILLDPVEEGMRIDYVSHAVGELVKELKVRGKDVRDVVSGQKVFMRFIKLPALDTVDNMAEQVGYEAQQHLPFPLEDIVFDYQLLGVEDGEQEVLLVAIKKDELDDLNGQVEANSLRTRSVDCSITSLYNAFKAVYPDETEPVMILDIGAKTTDILFVEEGRFFTRSVTAAGSFITNSIAREFNLSFREAEQLKIEQGVVSLGNGHTDTMPEDQANLASIISNAMTRLSSEVQRTINHYRAQYKGTPPAKVYICGGGARLAFTTDFLQNSLDLPVEILNPLQSMRVGSKVDGEQLATEALCLGPVVGAAITGAKVGAFQIDLVPTSVGKERAEKKLIPKVLLAGVIALAGAGFCAYAVNKQAKAAEEQLRRAAPDIERVDRLHANMERKQADYDRSLKDLEQCAALYAAGNAYPDLLIQIAQKTASPTFWITDMNPLVGYDVVNTTLNVGPDGTDHHVLLDTSESRSDTMLHSFEMTERNKAPQVTALLVSGYYYKNEGKDDLHQYLNKLVTSKFGEDSADSLFHFDSKAVEANSEHFFRDARKFKGHNDIPEYVDKFYMVMPLKTPLPAPVPSSDSAKK